MAQEEKAPRGEYTNWTFVRVAAQAGYKAFICHMPWLWRTSTWPDLQQLCSHRYMDGDRPKRTGPRPSGNVLRPNGRDFIGAQSSATRVTSSPCIRSDPHSRVTEYDGPLASSLMAGTI